MINTTAIVTFTKRTAVPMMKKAALAVTPKISDNIMNGNISNSMKALRDEKKARKNIYVEELKAEIEHQRKIEASAEQFEERQSATTRKLELMNELRDLECGRRKSISNIKVH